MTNATFKARWSRFTDAQRQQVQLKATWERMSLWATMNEWWENEDPDAGQAGDKGSTVDAGLNPGSPASASSPWPNGSKSTSWIRVMELEQAITEASLTICESERPEDKKLMRIFGRVMDSAAMKRMGI